MIHGHIREATHVILQYITTYLHSIAPSNDLNTLGLPLKKLCIDTKASIAVPENKNIQYCSIYFSLAHKPHPSQREGELGHAATDDHQETQLL